MRGERGGGGGSQYHRVLTYSPFQFPAQKSGRNLDDEVLGKE